MSSRLRKVPVRHPVVVDIGCNCRRPKLSLLFSSNSRSKAKATLTDSFSPTTTTTTSFTAATFTATTDTSACEDTALPANLSSAAVSPEKGGRGTRRKKGRVARESVAVVKESVEPYADFRESMFQMIVDKEIYAWEDLNDLLHRFLALNSPRHHHLILRAFTDLWSGVFAPPSTSLLSNR
ncbi:uncharacterized protein [Elaeis guineensis]|uniref:Transcription repressor n=1 Tax=Elaeis guineensis var. tenera TaxID=51953 RepID=A0A6I9QK63_ELAGV|nr:transcription repressor OFP8 [Elaeis guineensis]